jgi:hypothetical protein
VRPTSNDTLTMTNFPCGSDNNLFARTCNSLCQGANDELTPLVNAATGAEIRAFPQTVTALNALPGVSVSCIPVAT